MASSPQTKSAEDWAAENATPADEEWAQINASPAVEVKPHTRKPPSQDWRKKVGGELPLMVGGAAGGVGGALLGGLAGGIGAPVGGVAGAGIGGALVDQGQRAIAQGMGVEGVPPPFSAGGTSEMLGKAQEQMLYQGVPEAIAGVAKPLGKGLMQLAAKSTPEVAQTAIREGVKVTKAGIAKTLTRIGEMGDAAMSIARRWDARGLRYNTMAMGHDVESGVLPKILKQAHTQDDIGKLFEMTEKFLQDNGGTVPGGALTNEQLLTFKRTSDEVAQPIWKKIQNKEPITGNEKVEYLWHSEFANQARDHLHALTEPHLAAMGIPQNEHTALALADQKAAELIKLKEALVDVVKPGEGFLKRLAGRSVGPAAGATIGAYANPNHAEGAMKGAVAGALATSPTVLSSTALAMSSPMLAEWLRLLGRGAGTANDMLTQ